MINLAKRELLDIYHHALEAVKPDKLIRRSVTISNGNLIVTNPLNANAKPCSYELKGSRLHVIGGGKCVLGMAESLAKLANESSCTDLFSHGCLSLPVNQEPLLDQATIELLNSVNITCRFGAENNLPDQEAIEATQKIFDCVDQASKQDGAEGSRPLFIVLLSGGGSACLTKPMGTTLEDKLYVIQALVRGGADIKELNLARQRMSGVKGGRLAEHILKSNPRSQILSLIISDVPGDPIESIASGPTSTVHLSYESMPKLQDLERKYGCDIPSPQIPFISKDLDTTSVSNVILGNNVLALGAAANRARELGYGVVTVSALEETGTKDIVDFLDTAVIKRKQRSSKCLGIIGGEACIRKDPNGKWGSGGRAQEMALTYMADFVSFYTDRYEFALENVPDDFIDLFFAGTTDGQDGPTDVSGCFASVAEFIEQKPFEMSDLNKALWDHDSNTFLSRHKPEWLVKTGPTGTNVMDLYMLAKIY